MYAIKNYEKRKKKKGNNIYNISVKTYKIY